MVHLLRNMVWFKRQFVVGVFIWSAFDPIIRVFTVLVLLDVLRWDDCVVSDVVLVYAPELLLLLQIASI
jgi:hypothetical protein